MISQFISGISCLIYMKAKFPILKMQPGEWAWNGHCVATLCHMGVPMGLQYSITAIGSVILQAAVNNLGSNAVASITAANRISMFIVCPFDALGSTMATYGGQNVGAMELGRVKEGLKSATILGLCYAIIAFLSCSLLENISCFCSCPQMRQPSSQMHGLSCSIQSCFYFPLALVNIVRFLIQGMGFSIFAILAGVMEMLARSIVAFTLVPAIGFLGACFASPFAGSWRMYSSSRPSSMCIKTAKEVCCTHSTIIFSHQKRTEPIRPFLMPFSRLLRLWICNNHQTICWLHP